MAKILEVCVDSYASAMAAIVGGADRLELCSALAVGGLTPSPALLRQIREVSPIPVRCLMRTRGGDFLYTPEEIQQMAMEIKMLKQEGFYVSVITTMNQDNAQDLEALYEVFSELKIDAWQLQNCSPMGNAGCIKAPDPAAQRRILEFVAEKAQTGSRLIGLAHNAGYFSPEERWIRGNPGQNACFSGCKAGLSAIGIDSVGNVRGCESLYDERFIEGNIRNRSLVDIWNDENCFSYNRRFQTDTLLAGSPYHRD